MEQPTIGFKVEVVVEPDGTGFHAYCPALKGLHVDGASRDDALQNAVDAAVVHLLSLIQHGDPIPIGALDRQPEATTPQALPTNAISYTEALSVPCPI